MDFGSRASGTVYGYQIRCQNLRLCSLSYCKVNEITFLLSHLFVLVVSGGFVRGGEGKKAEIAAVSHPKSRTGSETSRRRSRRECLTIAHSRRCSQASAFTAARPSFSARESASGASPTTGTGSTRAFRVPVPPAASVQLQLALSAFLNFVLPPFAASSPKHLRSGKFQNGG